MKKLFLPLMIIAAFVAFNEQNKPQPNQYISIGCIVVFMFGMMRLMSKVPSKNHNEEESFVKSDYKIEDKSTNKEK